MTMTAPITDDRTSPTVPSAEPLLACHGVTVRYAIRYHYSDSFKDSLFHAVRSVGRGVARMIRGGSAPRGPANRTREVTILDAIDFEIHRGDIIGLVGRNGAGKSTLLRHLAGIEDPDAGMIVRNGSVGSLLNLSTGFKSELSGVENVHLRGAILGMTRQEIDRLMPAIESFCELGEFLYAPFRTYSAGMKARLGFAVAIHINPDILLLDEVIGVGDEKFKRKAGNIFSYLGAEKAVVLASHDSGTIKRYCNRCLWLDGGRVRMFGPAEEVADAYVAEMTRE